MTHAVVMMAALTLNQIPGKPASYPVCVGYVFGPHRDLDFKLYTHLCHAFLVADGWEPTLNAADHAPRNTPRGPWGSPLVRRLPETNFAKPRAVNGLP